MIVTLLLSWLAIGAAFGLATLLWPFRRGAAGAVINMLLAMSGAVLGGLFAVFVGHRPAAEPACLPFVAAGTLAAVCVGRVAWLAITGRPRVAGSSQSS
jgi:hypothetical protein